MRQLPSFLYLCSSWGKKKRFKGQQQIPDPHPSKTPPTTQGHVHLSMRVIVQTWMLAPPDRRLSVCGRARAHHRRRIKLWRLPGAQRLVERRRPQRPGAWRASTKSTVFAASGLEASPQAQRRSALAPLSLGLCHQASMGQMAPRGDGRGIKSACRV